MPPSWAWRVWRGLDAPGLWLELNFENTAAVSCPGISRMGGVAL